jgi:ABC-type Na+ transport system ATPase subunit NatA
VTGNGKGTLLYGVIFTLLMAVLGATIKQGIDAHTWRSAMEHRVWVIEEKLGLPHPDQ